MKIRNNSKGFGVVEVLLAVLAVVLLSGAGWYVYTNSIDSKDSTDSKASDSKSSSQTKSEEAKETKYLSIKEWGIKLPLSEEITDAYYVVSTSSNTDGKPDTVWLGLKSLDASGCSAAQANAGGDYPIGAIIKSAPDEKDPVSGESATQVNPDGVTINGQYYAYHSGIQGSSTNRCVSKNSIANAEAIDSALKAAGKGIVAE